MSTIRQVDIEDDIEIVEDLFWEYLQWANSRNYEEFGIKLDITAMLKDDMDKLDIFPLQMVAYCLHSMAQQWPGLHV